VIWRSKCLGKGLQSTLVSSFLSTRPVGVFSRTKSPEPAHVETTKCRQMKGVAVDEVSTLKEEEPRTTEPPKNSRDTLMNENIL
jgi:hypothetical protein